MYNNNQFGNNQNQLTNNLNNQQNNYVSNFNQLGSNNFSSTQNFQPSTGYGNNQNINYWKPKQNEPNTPSLDDVFLTRCFFGDYYKNWKRCLFFKVYQQSIKINVKKVGEICVGGDQVFEANSDLGSHLFLQNHHNVIMKKKETKFKDSPFSLKIGLEKHKKTNPNYGVNWLKIDEIYCLLNKVALENEKAHVGLFNIISGLFSEKKKMLEKVFFKPPFLYYTTDQDKFEEFINNPFKYNLVFLPDGTYVSKDEYFKLSQPNYKRQGVFMLTKISDIYGFYK